MIDDLGHNFAGLLAVICMIRFYWCEACCWCCPGNRENKPNYTHIFNSETLQRIAAQLPLTVPELAAVEGVAAVKAERYGTEFLEIAMKFTCKLSGIKRMLC